LCCQSSKPSEDVNGAPDRAGCRRTESKGHGHESTAHALHAMLSILKILAALAALWSSSSSVLCVLAIAAQHVNVRTHHDGAWASRLQELGPILLYSSMYHLRGNTSRRSMHIGCHHPTHQHICTSNVNLKVSEHHACSHEKTFLINRRRAAAHTCPEDARVASLNGR
jgi:hypothetical protein